MIWKAENAIQEENEHAGGVRSHVEIIACGRFDHLRVSICTTIDL
jgi:hypothetical protein